MPEPGLDWSLKGFTPAEFATVGQLGEKVDVLAGTLMAKDESIANNIEMRSTPKSLEVLKSNFLIVGFTLYPILILIMSEKFQFLSMSDVYCLCANEAVE